MGLTCEFELCGFEKYEGYFYVPHIFPQNAIDASMWDAPIFDVTKSDACFNDIYNIDTPHQKPDTLQLLRCKMRMPSSNHTQMC